MKRSISRGVATLCVALSLAGCKIVVEPNGGGGGGGSSSSGSSSSAATHDDGASTSQASTSSGGTTTTTTTQSTTTSSSQPPAQRRKFVGGFRSDYAHLPNMGETKKYFRVHGNRAEIDRGYYRGDWDCGAAGMMKNGAGHGESVIDGHLEIKGDNWVLRGVTITGNVEIRGNNNDITGCEVFGRVDIRGTGNKTK